MLTYQQFINESSNDKMTFYTGIIVRITSRKSIDEVLKITKEDYFHYDGNWELYDKDKKLFKVTFDKPMRAASIINNMKGDWYKLKFKIIDFIGEVKGMVTSEDEKKMFQNFIETSLKKGERMYYSLNIFKFFLKRAGEEYLKSFEYERDLILDKISREEKVDRKSLFNTTQIKSFEDNKRLFLKGIELLINAVKNGDLNLDINALQSLLGGSKFKIFD